MNQLFHFTAYFFAVAFVAAVTASTRASDIVTEKMEYTHEGVTLQGYLAYDASSEERRPGVLIVHEWWGHDEYVRRRAREVAELGYVAFALDMFGKGVHTDDPAEAQRLSAPFRENNYALMRSRARAGLDVLAGHERVDRRRMAAMGYCFGGTVSLQLAYSGSSLRGVVSFHGSLASPQREDDINIQAKILVLHGAEDPLVPEPQIAAFMNAMDRAGADWQMIYYGHAVHSFTNPDVDRHNIPGARYDERADRRSWSHMRLFFEELFAE